VRKIFGGIRGAWQQAPRIPILSILGFCAHLTMRRHVENILHTCNIDVKAIISSNLWGHTVTSCAATATEPTDQRGRRRRTRLFLPHTTHLQIKDVASDLLRLTLVKIFALVTVLWKFAVPKYPKCRKVRVHICLTGAATAIEPTDQRARRRRVCFYHTQPLQIKGLDVDARVCFYERGEEGRRRSTRHDDEFDTPRS
jgi:hypothetical protein